LGQLKSCIFLYSQMHLEFSKHASPTEINTLLLDTVIRTLRTKNALLMIII